MFVDLLTWDFRLLLQGYVAWSLGIAAILWGGGPERAVAITWLLLFELVPSVYEIADTGDYFQGQVDGFFATIDGLAAAAWITIALYANRNYTLWIAAMQVLAVAAHLASAIAEPITPIGYAVMVVAPGWIQLLLLGIGLVRHVLRKRKFGAYRDWRIGKYTDDRAEPGKYGNVLAAWLSKDLSSWRDGLK